MKENISKILMGIASLIIALIAICCLFKGEIKGAIIFLLVAILVFPFVQDRLDKKSKLENKYYMELRGFLTFFSPIVLSLLALELAQIMTAHGYEDIYIIKRVEAVLQIIMYLLYLFILFMYNENDKKSKKRKYIIFGGIYCVCVLISYIPNDIMVFILNKLSDNENFTLCSYELLIEAILNPIKEAILTYIMFDTVRELKKTEKHNKIEEDKESTENKTKETNTQSQYNDSAEFEVEVKDNKTGHECSYEISVKQRD